MSTKTDSIRRQRSKYDSDNATAAAIILASPDKYAGIQTMWAALYRSRHSAMVLNPHRPSLMAHSVRLERPPVQGGLFDQPARGERAAAA